MKALFAPAIALMSRLRYRNKFLLLGAAVGVVIAVLLYTVFVNLSRDIKVAEDELAGLQMLKPMNRMVQFMQQHRGLSSGVLNGNEAMKDKRAAKEKELADAVMATDAALSGKLRDLPAWKVIRDDWEAIRKDGLSWTPPDNIKRHTQMIDKALVFMVDIADDTQLTLDPEMNTYYFMDTVVSKMPAMLEPMGITRARGTGVLTKKELAPQMRIDIAATIARCSRRCARRTRIWPRSCVIRRRWRVRWVGQPGNSPTGPRRFLPWCVMTSSAKNSKRRRRSILR